MRRWLSGSGYRCVIADESHYLKNQTTKRSMAVLPLLQKAKHAILLSGTPATSRPKELWPQLCAVRPDLFDLENRREYRDYARRYCGGFEDPTTGIFDDSRSSNLDELNVLLRGVMTRRQKSSVLTQLPPKVRQEMEIEPTGALMPKIVEGMENLESLELALKDAEDDDERAQLEIKVKGCLSKLYEATGQAKLEAAMGVVNDLLDSGSKLLLFAHHGGVMDGFACALTRKKAKFIRIDGKTPAHHRQGLCDKFQENSEYRVALLSITAAGVGLTLNAADAVVFAELDWTPGNLNQAEDRAHRVGQVGSVIVKYLLAPNTLDTRMWNTVKRKLSVVTTAVDGTRSTSRSPLSPDVEFRGPDDSSTSPPAMKQPKILDFFRSPGGSKHTVAEAVVGEHFVDEFEMSAEDMLLLDEASASLDRYTTKIESKRKERSEDDSDGQGWDRPLGQNPNNKKAKDDAGKSHSPTWAAITKLAAQQPNDHAKRWCD